MKIKLLLLSLFAVCSVAAYAQDGGVKGRVISREGRHVIDGAKVTIKSETGYSRSTETNMDGTFQFGKLNEGKYKLIFETGSGLNLRDMEIPVNVMDKTVDLGIVSLASEYSNVSDLDEFGELESESGESQAMPVLSASKDVFDNIAGFKFSSIRFRTRGYDQSTQNVYLNGIYFNDALTGYSPWSLWSGLNDATRNQEVTGGSAISDYGVGGINGTTNINARASQVRKGYRFSLVNASGQYRFRVMATYGSGELDNGWSYALSVSTRQGGNDWVNGVFYNSWGYFGSVEKKLNPFNRLAFTFLGTPGERAVQAASTQEVYDLVGSNYYNPNWGYQGGTKDRDMRNARMRENHEPIAILNYEYEPNAKFTLSAAVSYRFGKNGYSALDWVDGQDPRPDYYRNLPSYYETSTSNYDPVKADYLREGWLSDWNIRQLNWQNMYDINQNNYFKDSDINYYGGMNPSGLRRSVYVIEDRRADQRDFNAKVQIMSLLGRKGKLNVGFEFRKNRTEYYKRLKDLLGGDYYLDIDKFAERDIAGENVIQSNLHTPYRLVKKGDKYGYDYYAHVQSDKLWATYRLTAGNFNISLAAENGHTTFWREGRYKKGLFPDNSEGKSEKQSFWTYNLKAGIHYRIGGAHMIYANFARIENAPYFQNAFVSPRTRNTVVDDLKTEKITSVDLNYSLRLPTFKLRATAFYTYIQDKSKVISYYNDLADVRSFTNFAMTGIDQRHMGFEIGFSAPIIAGITTEGAFSYGHYYYSSNPYVTQTQDNNEKIIMQNERVYWKDMKVESTPQTAANLGFRWRGPRNIYVGIDVNYFDAMYLSMSPIYRTDQAHVGLSGAASKALAAQEMFDNAFVLNANIGKSWYIDRKYNLGFSLDVRNILNDKDIKTGGYEQMRLSKTSTGSDTLYSRFSSKYFYMFGTTYYLNIYLRF